MYSGPWRFTFLCSRCKEWKQGETKHLKVCSNCSACNKQGLTKKKDNVLKAFRKKYNLPHYYPLKYLLLIKGKIRLTNDIGQVTKDKIEWLMSKRKDKLIETAKELLRLENDWRKTKHLKPLKKLGFEQKVLKGGFEK
jgi:hypothetical protein